MILPAEGGAFTNAPRAACSRRQRPRDVCLRPMTRCPTRRTGRNRRRARHRAVAETNAVAFAGTALGELTPGAAVISYRQRFPRISCNSHRSGRRLGLKRVRIDQARFCRLDAPEARGNASYSDPKPGIRFKPTRKRRPASQNGPRTRTSRTIGQLARYRRSQALALAMLVRGDMHVSGVAICVEFLHPARPSDRVIRWAGSVWADRTCDERRNFLRPS
jgi:hypothetical protein